MFLVHEALTLDSTGSLRAGSISLLTPELWRQPPSHNSTDGPGRICPEHKVSAVGGHQVRTSSERRSRPSKQRCWDSLPAAAWSQAGRRVTAECRAAGGGRPSSRCTDVERGRGLPGQALVCSPFGDKTSESLGKHFCRTCSRRFHLGWLRADLPGPSFYGCCLAAVVARPSLLPVRCLLSGTCSRS